MLINLLGFNLSWFGLILFGDIFIPLTLIWLGIHLYLCKQLGAEFKLIFVIVLLGTLVDTFLFLANILIFPNYNFIPFWLVALWAAFAATISHSLIFLEKSLMLQALVGFVFPPLSYLAGASLSVVSFGYSQLATYFILAFIWPVLMILFFQLKDVFYSQENNYA